MYRLEDADLERERRDDFFLPEREADLERERRVFLERDADLERDLRDFLERDADLERLHVAATLLADAPPFSFPRAHVHDFFAVFMASFLLDRPWRFWTSVTYEFHSLRMRRRGLRPPISLGRPPISLGRPPIIRPPVLPSLPSLSLLLL